MRLVASETNRPDATRRGTTLEAESRSGVPLQSLLSKRTMPEEMSAPPVFTLKEAVTPSAKRQETIAAQVPEQSVLITRPTRFPFASFTTRPGPGGPVVPGAPVVPVAPVAP